MKRLNELFTIDNDMKIYSIHSDSRYVKPYSIFFCIEGLNTDGHQYVDDAIFQGAKCIVHSKNIEDYHEGIVYIQVDNALDELNRVADVFYDYPSEKMKVVGITGSYGKTVVALMVKNILSSFCKTGYIGTVSLEYDNVVETSPYTTPETIFLQKHLYAMQKRGVKVVAMETSSHGLYLHRVDSVHFDIAVLTTIGNEHLDFHGTKEQYIASKQILFEKLSPQGYAILNKDDPSSKQIQKHTKAKVITYGIEQDADIMAKNIQLTLRSTFFDLYYKGNIHHIHTPTLAKFNVYNILAVVSVMAALGSDERRIIDSIESIKPIPGRMERISNELGIDIIIDYCQTIRNYEEVFSFVKSVKRNNGRLIAVFGAPGKRNISSRKEIGRLANKYCDHVILTEQDDRGEDVETICTMIQDELKGINSVIITNRQIAIEQAIELACRDDVILILGKGHEQFISLGVGEAQYAGDKQVVEDAIKRIYGGENDEIQYYD